MSNALDDFERTLVNASRALSAQTQALHATPSRNGSSGTPGRWHLIRRARQLSVAIQLGLAVSSFSALAGGGVATYLLLSADNTTRTLASFECDVSRDSAAGISAVTGDPIVDCAAAWPSATAGRASAPPLAAWGTSAGKEVAVVRPASWGPPSSVPHWRRLPAGWTVDLQVVEISDQLSDLSISPYGGRPCTYLSADERVIRSLLKADGLGSWHVVVSPLDHGEPVSAGCRFTIPNVDAGAQTVQLLQSRAQSVHVHVAPQQQKLINAGNLANRKLTALEKRVNSVLATRCESVNAATALWTSEARAAGFGPTTLAYYRAVNTNPPPVASRFDYYYTLVKQPASQHTGSCAHVLVMRAGGGSLTVYAARITP